MSKNEPKLFLNNAYSTSEIHDYIFECLNCAYNVAISPYFLGLSPSEGMLLHDRKVHMSSPIIVFERWKIGLFSSGRKYIA